MASAKADCEEGEVARAATDHAVSEPGRSETRELEARIRALLRAEHDHQARGRVRTTLPR
jgi:hypothetical protein